MVSIFKVQYINVGVCLTVDSMVPCIRSVIHVQMTSKGGKIKKTVPYLSLMFLPHSDVACNLLLNRCTVIWNLLFCFIKLPGENSVHECPSIDHRN